MENEAPMLTMPTIEQRLQAMENLLEEMNAILTHFKEMAAKIEEGIAQSPMASMLGMRR